MRCYSWKKPELTVTLTPGGTLAASTQYWLIAQFRSGLGVFYVFWSGNSPISDVATFTTDAVNKSISVAWKTTGNITAYADAGGGEVLVTSEKHCLDTGDEITIESGAYAGVYDITWVSYDIFKITATWGATGTATWRCEELMNEANGIRFWLHSTNPLNADGSYNAPAGTDYRHDYMSHIYSNVAYQTNPVVVTAPYALTQRPYDSPFFLEWDKSWAMAWETGMPYIYGTETSTTLEDIHAAFDEAGMYPYCRASSNDITYYGFIDLDDVETVFEDITVHCLLGGFKMRAARLTRSMVMFSNTLVRNFCGFIAENTMTGAVGIEKFDIFPSDYSADNFNPMKIVTNTDLSSETRSKEGMYVANIAPGNTNFPYPRGETTVKNSQFYNQQFIYIIFRTAYPAEGFRTFRGLTLKKSQYTSDFWWHTYEVENYVVNLENIDTDRAKNLKANRRLGDAAKGILDMIFWRTGTFYINDDIDGASILIVAGDDEYEYVSVNGVVDFDIIEQKSYPRWNTPGYYDDRIIEDFVITISKDGYQIHTLTVPLARDLVGLYVELTPVIPPIYINQEITGSIETIEIEGEITQTEITGSIETTEIEGEIKQTEITGSIETIEITGEIIN